MKNKIIAFTVVLILILIFAAGALSCGGEGDKSPPKEQNVSPEEGTNGEIPEDEPSDPRLAVKEDIPNLDFKNQNFTILYPTWSMYNDYYFAEDEIGEKMNDAVYRRTKNVEERFNIKINPVTVGYIETIHPTISKAVKAGSDDYQMTTTHCIAGVAELAAGGFVLDWNKIPIVDFAKPWWNQRMNETMSVDGVLLTAVSDFIIFDPNVIYFNKRIAKELDIGDVYKLVNDGKWTWAKLAELAKLASKDINGDGKFDSEDQYGFVTHIGWMMENAIQSCGMYISKIGEEGYPENNLNTERFGNLINMLYELMCVGNQTFLGDWDANNLATVYESQVPMSSDRVLFHVDPLSAGKRYRAYDVEFGILPFPKYDEAQAEYLSLSWNGFIMIPQTADPEFAGAVNEALAAESYRLTVPAYYDVLLNSKVARDVESTEMIDIIAKGAVYDFALNFGNWNAISLSVSNLLNTKKSPDYVSFMEKNENGFNKQMRKVYDEIRKNYLE
ncbi:MAG: extracellular solute-binding protein [Oscillospiraceae bacterium]|nr:extracellular solute-binding protein [Oscillospiraceae bacterium]